MGKSSTGMIDVGLTLQASQTNLITTEISSKEAKKQS